MRTLFLRFWSEPVQLRSGMAEAERCLFLFLLRLKVEQCSSQVCMFECVYCFHWLERDMGMLCLCVNKVYICFHLETFISGFVPVLIMYLHRFWSLLLL